MRVSRVSRVRCLERGEGELEDGAVEAREDDELRPLLHADLVRGEGQAQG